MIPESTDPTKAPFPDKATQLFKPAPYKVMYGGRGGGKSWSAARALLILASQRNLFVLCAREIQKSIKESVHKLLVDQIEDLGFNDKKLVYRVTEHSIENVENGSRFVFAGVRNNITAIKSMEAIDICYVEEAEKVTGHSWSTLLPTIRRDAPHGPFGRGSEVWIVFNPDLDSDFTYKYWVLAPPEGTIKMEMNWKDNPWFPDFSNKQRKDLKERDKEDYDTIWGGQVRRIVRGAIYAKELGKAQSEKRISPNIHVDRQKPIDIGVDIGRADMTSMWFMQQIGMEHHAVDFYENSGFDWSHYLEQIQARKYPIGRIYLPHDASNEHVAAPKSVYRQTKDLYPNEGTVIRVPRTKKVANDINAVRAIFPRLYFNELTCSSGIHSLAHYRYEVNPEDTKDISNEPLHDWSSHACDALRTYVMGLRAEPRTGPQMHMPMPPPQSDHAQGWMAV